MSRCRCVASDVAITNDRAQRGVARCVTLRRCVGPLSVMIALCIASAGDAAPRREAPKQTEDPTLRPIARVNGQEITWRELAEACTARYGGEVLESLVNKHLILMECQRRGIGITQKHVDDEIISIANKFDVSPQQWVKLLEDERNISLNQYRNDIVWPTLALKKLAAEQLQVSEAEIDKAYEAEYGAKVQVRMIAVGSSTKADSLLQQARANPDDFGRLAKDHSEDENSAAARGLIPPVRRHVGDPEFERVAFGLEPGEISPVLRIANQYLILKCEREIPPAHIAPQYQSDARAQLADQIREGKLRDTAGEMFRTLQKDANVTNVWNNSELRAKMPGIAATINDRKITLDELRQACFDRYAKEILEGEVNYRILRQELDKQKTHVSKTELDAEIARAAESYGYTGEDGRADVERWLKEIASADEQSDQETVIAHYIRDAVWPSVALKKLVSGSVQVTDDDMQKAFVANYGRRVEALAIVLNNQRTAQEVWELARGNASRAYFGQLANQYSVEPVSRANFGEIPPIGRHGGQPLVEREAFKLKVGELSGIIATGDKYVILHCLGHTEPVVEQLKEVAGELRTALLEKKTRIAMAEEFDRLKGIARVENLLERRTARSSASRPVIAQPVSQPRAARKR